MPVNPVHRTTRFDSAHDNFMAGPSWDLSDPVARLRMVAASCFFGEPHYYPGTKATKDSKPSRLVRATVYAGPGWWETTLSRTTPPEWSILPAQSMLERAIDETLAHDAERTLQTAVELRNEDHIRVTPQVILVRAANTLSVKGTKLVRQYAPQIIKRMDEPATQMAYQIAAFGKPIPNSLKRAWSDALSGAKEYQLAKYRMEARAVKTVDVVNISHPASPSVNKLVRGELTLDDSTWESHISSHGSSPESWANAVPLMGHMALLRNIRNLLDNKVPTEDWLGKLVGGVADGQQLPFRYWSAYRAVKDQASPLVLDAIEDCLMLSYANAPSFSGRVMSLCDNSGSAQNTTTSSLGTVKVSEIANLTGLITGALSDEGYVGIFGDRLETFPVRKRSSVFDQLENAGHLARSIGESTENGIWLFWDKAIKERQHWDKVFVYSDMQAGHGQLYGTDASKYSSYLCPGDPYRRYIDVPKLIGEYRRTVNPNVLVFLVQVAGYEDTIVPEFYDRTFILGGWSDGILRFAAKMAGLYETPKQ